jgi:hypothetical protein
LGPRETRRKARNFGAFVFLAPRHRKVIDVRQSPLHDLRESLGLSRTQWADALGVAYNQAHLAENGRAPLPRKAKRALADLGVDVADLERRQDAWIDNRAQELRDALRGGVAYGR